MSIDPVDITAAEHPETKHRQHEVEIDDFRTRDEYYGQGGGKRSGEVVFDELAERIHYQDAEKQTFEEPDGIHETAECQFTKARDSGDTCGKYDDALKRKCGQRRHAELTQLVECHSLERLLQR